jgi:hypothetical protein
MTIMDDPDMVAYPDIGRFGAIAVQPGPEGMRVHLKFIGPAGERAGHWGRLAGRRGDVR